MRIEWRDLSDSELRAKLNQRARGRMAANVGLVVRHREDDWADAIIESVLNP